jgi:hypothetical protein
MIFPIGVMTLLGRRRKRRERSFEARLEEVEKKVDDLTEKITSSGD